MDKLVRSLLHSQSVEIKERERRDREYKDEMNRKTEMSSRTRFSDLPDMRNALSQVRKSQRSIRHQVRTATSSAPYK